MFFPHWGLFFYRVKSGLFIFPIREIFFSNWASNFARFLNHDAKIRNPVLSVVRLRAIPCDSGTFFLHSLFFVFTEVGTDGFNDVGQLFLLIAQIGNKIGLHTA